MKEEEVEEKVEVKTTRRGRRASSMFLSLENSRIKRSFKMCLFHF